MTQSAEDHLPSFSIRPRFMVETKASVEEITSTFKKSLVEEEASCEGRVRATHITLYIPHTSRHYWSPQLSINLEEDKDCTVIRGLYGPRPSVWTMFVFFYTLIGLAILIIATMGYSYYTLGKPTTILWWVPVLAGAFLTLYLVSYFGQKVGHNQMVILHDFFEKTSGLNTLEKQ